MSDDRPRGLQGLIAQVWPKSLIGRSMLVVGAILSLQLAASLIFYANIDREALREDHAHRLAELLIVSQRVHGLAVDGRPSDAGQVMSSSYLQVSVSPRPPARPPATENAEVAAIHQSMIRWEPELARADLYLWNQRSPAGGRDLVGVMRLHDGQWLSFRSRDFARSWPMVARVTLMTTLFAGLGLLFAFFVLSELGRPLRYLASAARNFGHGPHAPVRIEGSAELRDLEQAFNDMQDRIAGLIQDQARSMEAISHDMRTPLSRMQLAAQFAEPEDVRELFVSNVEELDQMLRSLSAYLRAQHQVSLPEAIDVAAMTRGVMASFDEDVTYEGPDSLVLTVHREPLEGALRRLIENAVRHGGGAEVVVGGEAASPTIQIRDRGPGMSSEDLAQIYEPFFRGDRARARDTAGFGLGVPTAARLLARFGGRLEIVNAPDGGLLATVTPPRA